MNGTLIFVYNADSGAWNGYMDMLHKIISPKTYPCHLCDITYGIFSIRKEWKEFIEQQSIPMRFLHKDEWENEFQSNESLPAIFIEKNGKVEVWIDEQTMKGLDLNGLKSLIEKKLKIAA
ncbi:MAG: hypothetical protein R2879_00255 [Saprospiraceae bacterium]